MELYIRPFCVGLLHLIRVSAIRTVDVMLDVELRH